MKPDNVLLDVSCMCNPSYTCRSTLYCSGLTPRLSSSSVTQAGQGSLGVRLELESCSHSHLVRWMGCVLYPIYKCRGIPDAI